MNDLRSPSTQLFWVLHSLPRWEQRAFLIVNAPFQAVVVILKFLLFIPFHVMILLRLPFLLLVLCTSVFWALCLGVILALSFVSEAVPLLRPVTFILALPLLVVGHNLTSLIPSPSPSDIEAQIAKWDLIEAFPLTFSLFRFNPSDDL